MKRAMITGALLFATACADGAATGTSPTVITTQTQTFTSSLAVGASRFYSFSVTQGGTVYVTLASVSSPATGHALADQLEIGLGTPAGTGCSTTATLVTRPSLAAQLQRALTPGTYCVRVADAGQLVAPVNFAVRFTYP